MAAADNAHKKAQYFERLLALVKEYPRVFIVSVDNVGSNQMQQIRKSLRGRAIVLLGKNTLIRKALKNALGEQPDLEKLMQHVRYNVGFVFTHEDLAEVRELIVSNKVAAPAKSGTVAPKDVFVPAQVTMLGPEKTAFFQALSIPTKINKGNIEIISEIHLIKKGTKVGQSEATLLGMLNILPFSYGLEIRQVYDNGAVFEPSVLDITHEHVLKAFYEAAADIAAISLKINYPTLASVPHSLVNGFKDVAAAALAADYSFPLVDKIKEAISRGPATGSAPVSSGSAGKPAAKEEKKVEKEESDDDVSMGDLFG